MAIDTRQKIMGHTTGNITQDLYTFQYLEPIKKALDMLATCENKLTFLPIAKWWEKVPVISRYCDARCVLCH